MQYTNPIDQLTNLPWNELRELFRSFEVAEKISNVPIETFQFAVDKENREFLVTSALKSLEKSDPENATKERAESLADMMSIFAKMVIEEYENRDYNKELTK